MDQVSRYECLTIPKCKDVVTGYKLIVLSKLLSLVCGCS